MDLDNWKLRGTVDRISGPKPQSEESDRRPAARKQQERGSTSCDQETSLYRVVTSSRSLPKSSPAPPSLIRRSRVDAGFDGGSISLVPSILALALLLGGWYSADPGGLLHSLGSRLRLRPAATSTAQYFSIGSTKDEVRLVQGIPSRTRRSVWHFGESAVYFLGDRVSGWRESPRDPLKTLPPPE